MNISDILIISSDIRKQMLEHVVNHLPEEACGFLVGRDRIVEMVIPVANDLHSSSRYKMNPYEQINGLKWIEDHQFDLLGIFHSHPAGPVFPSETDVREYAYPEAVCVICAPVEGDWCISGFWILDRHINACGISEI